MVQTLRAHPRLSAIFVVFGLSLLFLHAALGTPEGGSYMFNLPWFEGFRDAVWAGDLYPRFLPDIWFGMGALDFYFYGPLPFWVASTLGQVTCPGCSTGTVFSVSGAWMIILSGVTFFVFARRYFTAAYAGFGAFVYMLLPYHYVMDWFDRQSVGEIASLIFLPLLALAATKLIEERKGGALFALSFAAIALSHMPTTLILVHLLAALVTWTVLTRFETWNERIALLARFAIWGGLGVALSAFYWLPALALLDSVSPDMLYNEYYNATNWLLLDGRPEFTAHISSAIKSCLLLIVVTAMCAAWVLRQRTDTPSTLRLWIVGPSLFTAFLMTVFSYPVWEYWILNRIQFPWRTLTVADLSIALSAIVVARYFVETRGTALAQRARLLSALCAISLVFGYIAQTGRVSETVSAGMALKGEFAPVAVPEYVPPLLLEPALTRFRARTTDETSTADRYEMFFEEMRRSRDQAYAWMLQDAPGASFSTGVHDRSRLQVTLTEPTRVRVPVAVWPFWRAQRIDGTELPLIADPETGLFSVDLPAGRSDITFRVLETAPQKLGSVLSLMALLVLLGGTLAHGYTSFGRRKKPLATSLA